MIFMISFSLIVLLVMLYINGIDYINSEINSGYSEVEVQNLKYILEKYNEGIDKSIDKKQMIYYYLLNSYRENNYIFNDGDIEDYIDNLYNKKDMFVLDYSIKQPDFTIEEGDYYSYAVYLLDNYYEELKIHNVSESIFNLDTIFEYIIGILFIVLYLIVIFRFILLNIFDKKLYFKNILMFLIKLIIIFVLNILVVFLAVKFINYLGSYKGYEFYEAYAPNKLIYYGLFTIDNVLLMFFISLIINNVINIKDIIKYFKERKSTSKK